MLSANNLTLSTLTRSTKVFSLLLVATRMTLCRLEKHRQYDLRRWCIPFIFIPLSDHIVMGIVHCTWDPSKERLHLHHFPKSSGMSEIFEKPLIAKVKDVRENHTIFFTSPLFSACMYSYVIRLGIRLRDRLLPIFRQLLQKGQHTLTCSGNLVQIPTSPSIND